MPKRKTGQKTTYKKIDSTDSFVSLVQSNDSSPSFSAVDPPSSPSHRRPTTPPRPTRSPRRITTSTSFVALPTSPYRPENSGVFLARGREDASPRSPKTSPLTASSSSSLNHSPPSSSSHSPPSHISHSPPMRQCSPVHSRSQTYSQISPRPFPPVPGGSSPRDPPLHTTSSFSSSPPTVSSSSSSPSISETGGNMSASFSFGTTKIERTDRQKREEFLELDGDVKVEEKKEGEKEGEGKAVPSDQMMDQMLKNDWMKIFPHTFSSIEAIGLIYTSTIAPLISGEKQHNKQKKKSPMERVSLFLRQLTLTLHSQLFPEKRRERGFSDQERDRDSLIHSDSISPVVSPTPPKQAKKSKKYGHNPPFMARTNSGATSMTFSHLPISEISPPHHPSSDSALPPPISPPPLSPLSPIPAPMVPQGSFYSLSSRGVFDDIEEGVLGWCGCVEQVWTNKTWIEVIHKISLFRKRVFSCDEIAAFQNLFSSFALEIKKKSTEEDKVKAYTDITYLLLHHLNSHPFDAGNLYIGCVPSAQLVCSASSFSRLMHLRAGASGPSDEKLPDLENCLREWLQLGDKHIGRVMVEMSNCQKILEKNRIANKGGIVFVRASALPSAHRGWFTNNLGWEDFFPHSFVLFRLAAPVSHGDKVVQVFLDPFETKIAQVQCNDVSLPNQETLSCPFISLEEEHGGDWEDPVASLFAAWHKCLKKRVAEMYETKGVSAPPLPSEIRIQKLKYLREQKKITEDIIFNDRSCVKDILTIFLEDFVGQMEKWLGCLPRGLVPPCRLDIFHTKVQQNLKLLQVSISRQIQLFAADVYSAFENAKKQLQNVIAGERKNEVCSWWLSFIEEQSDNFLSERGYSFSALPTDYTNDKPGDLSAVWKNVRIVQDAMNDEVIFF